MVCTYIALLPKAAKEKPFRETFYLTKAESEAEDPFTPAFLVQI